MLFARLASRVSSIASGRTARATTKTFARIPVSGVFFEKSSSTSSQPLPRRRSVPSRFVSQAYSTGATGHGIEEIEFNPVAANTINIIGNVGRKPEMKFLESGSKVSNFPVAFTDRKEGDTQWFDVEAWDELADIAANHIDKGERVALQGRLKVQDWTDREGNVRKSLRIVAQNIMRVRRNPMMAADVQGQSQQGQQFQQVQHPYAQQSHHQSKSSTPASTAQDHTYQSTDMPMTSEELWMNFFENTSGWYDNREKKSTGQINPKSPDFKKMDGGRDAPALWIESSSTPAWVKTELAKLDQFGSDIPPF